MSLYPKDIVVYIRIQLAVTGLTHKQAYKDVFVITLTKTAAVFVVIGFYYATGL